MNGRLGKDRLFIRLASDGSAIANSAIWRKQKPKGGSARWKDITACVLGCCDPEGSYVVFRATSLNGTSEVTSISFSGYSWTGTFESGDYLIVPLPYNQSVTITLIASVTAAAMSVSTSTTQGTGVIAGDVVVSTDPDPQTITLTVDSTTASQYLVTLTDD